MGKQNDSVESMPKFELDRAKDQAFALRLCIPNRDIDTFLLLWDSCFLFWNEFTLMTLLEEMYMFEWNEGIKRFLSNSFTHVIYKTMKS